MNRSDLSIGESDRHDVLWKGTKEGFTCRGCGESTPADDITLACACGFTAEQALKKLGSVGSQAAAKPDVAT
jgi:hypothetical protein